MGALRFSFDVPRLFDDDERGFVAALAAQTAQAMERGALYDAQRAARSAAEELADRLARLQQVTAELTGARDVEEIADIVVSHAANALGSPLASMSMLVDDDTLRVIRLHGASESTRQRWATFPVSADLPGSEAVRTNSILVIRSVEELETRYPLLAGQAPADRTLVCIPLSIGDRRLGVITLELPDRDRRRQPGPAAVPDHARRNLLAGDRTRAGAARCEDCRRQAGLSSPRPPPSSPAASTTAPR